jgi:hypothetical protein
MGVVRKMTARRKPHVKLKIVGELEIEADRVEDVSILLIGAERYRKRTAKLPKPPTRKAA